MWLKANEEIQDAGRSKGAVVTRLLRRKMAVFIHIFMAGDGQLRG